MAEGTRLELAPPGVTGNLRIDKRLFSNNLMNLNYPSHDYHTVNFYHKYEHNPSKMQTAIKAILGLLPLDFVLGESKVENPSIN